MNRRIYLAALIPFLPMPGCGDAGTVVGGPGAAAGGPSAPATAVAPAPAAPARPAAPASLAEARRGFQTRLARQERSGEPVETPPPNVFQVVQYPSPAGSLAAYRTPDPGDGQKHPAIVWITGGDCNSIGDVWSPAPPQNDQTAAAYRQAGLVMMFPSLRGGNQNPGIKEGFFGELDDVIAAGQFLAQQPDADPSRVYLGGHSTGGTLVLLVAAMPNPFRAVVSFGPVDDPSGYGPEYVPFNPADRREVELRSPGRWLASISAPTFVFEGTVDGNLDSLTAMARASTNPRVTFLTVPGANHFSILAPINRLIAERIKIDTGPTTNLAFTPAEVAQAFAAPRR